jgi:hypothetical protein
MDNLASKEVVDHILSHHGVLGMKWGQRRSRSELASVSVKTRSNPQHKTIIRTKGGKGLPAHPDAIAAKVVTQKLKKSGMHTLSNSELQSLATRANLESQVKRSGAGESTTSKGIRTVNEALKRPDAQLAVKTASSPIVRKHVRKVLATVGTTAALALAR